MLCDTKIFAKTRLTRDASILCDIADFHTQYGEQYQFVIAADMNAFRLFYDEQHYVP